MTVILEWTGPTLTLNGERKLHWKDSSDIIKQWRQDVAMVAVATLRRSVKVVPPVGIDVHFWQPTGNLADAAGHFPLAKAAIDGLVDAQILPNDSPAYVSWIRLWAPEKDPKVPRGLVKVSLELQPSGLAGGGA